MSTLTLRPIKDHTIEWGSATSGSNNHFERIDEASVNDADYVSVLSATGTVKRELFYFEPPYAHGSINSVKVFFRVKSQDGAPSIGASIVTNGSTHDAESETVTTSWATKSRTWATNPVTELAWAWDDITQLIIGVWGSKSSLTYNPFLSWLYVEIDYTDDSRFQQVTIRPNGAGDLTQLSPSTGNNYECVDEETLDTGDYVTDISLSNGTYTDLYAMGTAAVGKVLFIHVLGQVAEMGVVTTIPANLALKTNSSTQNGASVYLLPSGSYKELEMSFGSINPVTSAAWTQADIDALQAGISMVKSTSNSRCAQLYIIVGYINVNASAMPQIIGLRRR